ncbi:unnamed protein product [Fusarium equiseti]|uniref:Rhodopsin domain-containing protein n=1 Tax=Fusarium equiseti TaxID=61235 RepID=A0A8J2J0N8_FUSEQ|nr:unnamed protein product [Fusarium equiseti]
MKVPTILLLSILALLCFAAKAVAETAESLDGVSQCAPVVSTRNIERLCSNKGLSNSVNDCVRKSCTIRELLDFLKAEQSVCGRPDLDNDDKIRAVNFVILGIAVTAVTLRIVTKVYQYTRWGADDYLIMAALVFTIIQCIMMIALTYQGLGHNIWTLDDNAVIHFFVYLIIVECAYVLSLCLIKLSILWFFLRTFPGQGFQKIVKWTMVFNIMSTTCISVAALCQNFPTDPSKERWKDESSPGFRVNIHALALSHAGINVALDIWMFILPLTQLYHIGLKKRKKVGVMLIFSLGFFLIVVSCVRIPFMIDFSRSLNSTADSQGMIVWSNVESGVGILVACLPHTAPLLRAAMMRAKSMTLCSEYSDNSQNIFVDRDLATIQVTRLNGPTLVNSYELVLDDRGGLLAMDECPSQVSSSQTGRS